MKTKDEKEKTVKKEKNIHEGHRERLVDLIVNAGVDNVSDIQVVEYFLTYIFPRGDVNPLAHRLLERYECFTQIIDAEICDLMSVKGINERSAKKIKMFGELFYYYTSSKMGKKMVVKRVADIIDLVEDCLRFRTVENMLLFAISAANIITHKRRLTMNNSGQVGISVMELTNFLTTSKPVGFVIAHCHPYGKATPSQSDWSAFDIVKNLCETCGVNFIDSYIVGEDGVFSQREKRLVRTYCDIEQLQSIFSMK